MKDGRNIKIGFLQYDVQKDIRKNMVKLSGLLREKTADLFVLPELSDRGYLYESKQELLRSATAPEENELVCFLKTQSRERNCAFIAGIAERSGEEIHNSAVLIYCGKIAGVYRKIHLSDLEKTLFSPGTKNKTFEIGGVRIGVQICFDLWFPEMSREQLLQGADILCALANFGSKTTYEISRIRAVENLTPLILCNRVGREKNDEIDACFLGRSCILGMDGGYLEKGKNGSEVCAVGEVALPRGKGNAISSDLLAEVRKHYGRFGAEDAVNE